MHPYLADSKFFATFLQFKETIMICLLKLEIMIYYFSFTVAYLAPLSRERNVTHESLVYLVIKYTFSRELNFSNLFDG